MGIQKVSVGLERHVLTHLPGVRYFAWGHLSKRSEGGIQEAAEKYLTQRFERGLNRVGWRLLPIFDPGVKTGALHAARKLPEDRVDQIIALYPFSELPKLLGCSNRRLALEVAGRLASHSGTPSSVLFELALAHDDYAIKAYQQLESLSNCAGQGDAEPQEAADSERFIDSNSGRLTVAGWDRLAASQNDEVRASVALRPDAPVSRIARAISKKRRELIIENRVQEWAGERPGEKASQTVGYQYGAFNEKSLLWALRILEPLSAERRRAVIGQMDNPDFLDFLRPHFIERASGWIWGPDHHG